MHFHFWTAISGGSFLALQNRSMRPGQYFVMFALDVYGHVTDDMKRDAADKVSGVLKGAV